MKTFFSTWDEKSGTPSIHYSSPKKDARAGSHAESINMDEFKKFFLKYKDLDFDIMFETKDKDKSVLSAYQMFQSDADFKDIEI